MFWHVWPWGIWNLSSLSRSKNHTPCIGRRSLNHCTLREIPWVSILVACWGYIFSCWGLSVPFLLMVSSEARDLSCDANCLHGCLFPGNWDTFQSSLLLRGLIFWANLGPESITSCQATWHSTWPSKSLGGSWIILYQTLVWSFSIGNMLSLPTAPHRAQF